MPSQPLLQRLTRSSIVALSAIALLACVSALLVLTMSQVQADHLGRIDASSAQRVRAQQIALLALQLVRDSDLTKRAAQREELHHALAVMGATHEQLLAADAHPHWVDRIWLPSPGQVGRPTARLTSQLRAYLARAQALLALPDGALTPDNSDLAALLDSQAALVTGLEHAVQAYEAQSLAEIMVLQHTQIVLLFLLLGVLLGEALLIFRPLARSVGQDIAARDELAQSLRTTVKNLSDLTFAINHTAIVAITDVRGTILEANDKFCAISGYSCAELIGQDHRIINAGYHDQAFFRDLWRTIAHGQVWHGEIQNRAKNGHTYWVDTTIVPLLNEIGKPERYLAIRFDISTRKQLEHNLRERTVRLNLLNTIALGVSSGVPEEQIIAHTVAQAAQAFPTLRVAYATIDADDCLTVHHACQPASMPDLSGYSVFLADATRYLTALRTGEVVAIDDVKHNVASVTLAKVFVGGGTRAVLDVPLLYGTDLVGLLCFDAPTPHLWSTHEITTLTEVADYLAVTIRNARALQARAQAMDALRESEHRYRTLIAALAEGVLLQEADGQITTCNASAEHILGLTQNQLLGHTSMDPRWQTIHEDGRPFSGEDHPAMVALRTGAPVEHVVMGVQKPDGAMTWISINAQPLIRTDEATPYAVVTSFFDITARRTAEAEIQYQKTLLECQSEASEDGILVVSPEHRWLYSNRRFQEMWQLGDDIIAAGSSAVGLPAMAAQVVDATRFLANIEALYAQPEADRRDELERTDSRVFECYSAPVCGPDGTFYGRVWYYRDITERKVIERMKNEFVSVVSHELRTPLTSIRGALGLIAGGVGGALPPQVRGMVDIALKNSERLVRLINDILDIEKIESGSISFQLTPLALIPLITQAIEANRAYGDLLGVTFSLAQPAPDLWVMADADRLTQVITNLLSNAAKFSPPSECVLITLDRSAAGRVRVRVTDRGPGIPEDFRGRIFQKFAQADSSSTRQQGGTGLGLSISKAIVDRHGGQIGFTTATGEGTTFFFDLSEWQTLPPAPATPDAPTLPCILICEDDPDIAMLLALLLHQAGFATDTAQNAAQARSLLAHNSYAGMTLDIALPGEDGITLIRTLRDDPHTRDLPVVVVSARADQAQNSLQGDALGILDWLTKPIEQTQLVAAIIAAVQRVPATSQPRVLHVEDDPDIVAFLTLLLAPIATVIAAADVQTARQFLQHERFDLVILDLGLPDGSSVNLLPVLHQWQPPIPTLIFSAREVGPDLPRNVAGALVKSRTSNEALQATITGLLNSAIDSRPHPPASKEAVPGDTQCPY